MATMTDEAIRLLTDAGVAIKAEDEPSLPLTRVEICARLMAYCRDDPAQRPRLRWDTAIFGLADRNPEVPEWFLSEVEADAFGLPHLEGEGQGLAGFGDLLLHIERRLRDLWWSGSRQACASQALFYELRRAIQAQGAFSSFGRLRPRTRTPRLPPRRSRRSNPGAASAAVRDPRAARGGACLRCDRAGVRSHLAGALVPLLSLLADHLRRSGNPSLLALAGLHSASAAHRSAPWASLPTDLAPRSHPRRPDALAAPAQ